MLAQNLSASSLSRCWMEGFLHDSNISQDMVFAVVSWPAKGNVIVLKTCSWRSLVLYSWAVRGAQTFSPVVEEREADTGPLPVFWRYCRTKVNIPRVFFCIFGKSMSRT